MSVRIPIIESGRKEELWLLHRKDALGLVIAVWHTNRNSRAGHALAGNLLLRQQRWLQRIESGKVLILKWNI